MFNRLCIFSSFFFRSLWSLHIHNRMGDILGHTPSQCEHLIVDMFRKNSGCVFRQVTDSELGFLALFCASLFLCECLTMPQCTF